MPAVPDFDLEQMRRNAPPAKGVGMVYYVNGPAVDYNGDTAMHGAAYKHLPLVVRFLGDAGAKADVWNRLNKAGFTPLQIAAGIQRGMNFVFSTETEAAIRALLPSATP